MLGTDAGIVEPRRDAVRLGDLAVLVLEQIGLVAVENAGATAREAGGVLAVEAFARGFDTDDLDAGLVEEGMDKADGVPAAARSADRRLGKEGGSTGQSRGATYHEKK